MRSAAAIATVIATAVVGASAAGYTHEEGLVLARYANAAYCSSSLINSWACNRCEGGFSLGKVVLNSNTNIQAFTGYRAASNEIIVSFRGTVATSIKNWIEDLDTVQTGAWSGTCSGCSVHKGFWDSYNSVAGDVVASISALMQQHNGAQVTVVGHSLGGAMAAIAAVDFKVGRGIPVAKLVTFGEPRTGNTQFADYVRSTIPVVWRVVHNKDIVPHVPLQEWHFQHVATEIYYANDSSFKICNGSGEDASCSDQWKELWNWSLLDHLSYLGMFMGTIGCS